MNIFQRTTLQFLKKNKTRTIVTIIGVILSAAMITGVFVFISSLQQNMVENQILQDGDWHLQLTNLDAATAEGLKGDGSLREISFSSPVGHALLESNQVAATPYLSINAMSLDAFRQKRVELIAGRFPKNNHELIIGNRLQSDKTLTYRVDSRMELTVGDLPGLDNTVLQPGDSYYMGENGDALPELKNGKPGAYTIVGVYSASYFHAYYGDLPIYPSFTALEGVGSTAYISFKNPWDTYQYADRYTAFSPSINTELLRYMGVSGQSAVNETFYMLGAILFLIIMGGSVLLVYNAFSISVAERTRDFGILSSVGATQRQLRKMVIFEAGFISLIGIPIGVVSGILGIGVTLYLIGDRLAVFSTGAIPLYVHPLAVVLAVAGTLITVLLSALIPARRAGKRCAIDAIRQTQDVLIRPERVKGNRLFLKLFGLEGFLADKNFKRNRRQYRSTVLSLLVSVVLFVSSSAFTLYLVGGADYAVEAPDYDIALMGNSPQELDIYPQLLEIPGVTGGAKYQEIVCQLAGGNPGEEWGLSIVVAEDTTFSDFMKAEGVKEDELVAYNVWKTVDNETGKRMRGEILSEPAPLTVTAKLLDGKEQPLRISKYTELTPLGLKPYLGDCPVIIGSEKGILKAFPEFEQYVNNRFAVFTADDVNGAYQTMVSNLAAAGQSADHLNSVTGSGRNNRNLVLTVNVFSYGFIILISLITVANVFNTITTSMNLRRREFAMLGSVGMSGRSFRKMLRFECGFFGFKALLYGLPVSLLFTIAIYGAINAGVDTGFTLPWSSILISIVGVFVVVLLSMLYGIHKLNRRSIIDDLKNDNT